MTTTLPTDELVRDVLRTEIEALMAERAALPNGFPHRPKRAAMLKDIDSKLGTYNLLVLGR